KSATTDFGQSFFQGRVDRLTKLKSGMENANKGIKDIVNVIWTTLKIFRNRIKILFCLFWIKLTILQSVYNTFTICCSCTCRVCEQNDD
ncbi:hypothetical protein ACUOFC_18480, partial [Escherichia sp. TWPC-MK]